MSSPCSKWERLFQHPFLFCFLFFFFCVSLEPGTLRLLMKHCVTEQQPSPSTLFSQACCHQLCHRWLLPSLHTEFDTLPPHSLSSSCGLTLGLCTDSHSSLLDSSLPFWVWSLFPVACLVPARPLKCNQLRLRVHIIIRLRINTKLRQWRLGLFWYLLDLF